MDTKLVPDLPPGLVYVCDADPGIARLRRGKGFVYRQHDGRMVSQDRELQRIRKLAIPPAYEKVWICTSPHGHIQATGRDARGRKQYRYHTDWRSERDANKFDRLASFALALPRIRRRVAQDLQSSIHGREQLLATVVRLLDTTLGRIGNDEYARDNGSYGLTTLRNRHVQLTGNRLQLVFKGKSGVAHRLEVEDARLARVVRRCQDLPGQALFQYRDEAGELRGIGSSEVNSYLHEVAGYQFSAKDFRTCHGTVLAFQDTAHALQSGDRCFTLKQMLGTVSRALGNTPAVCRKAYIHPRVLELAVMVCAKPEDAQQLLARADKRRAPKGSSGLPRAEQRLLNFLALPEQLQAPRESVSTARKKTSSATLAAGSH